jgi:peptide-methionine (S)-S-oxide reductase
MNHSSIETAIFGGGCFWCTEAVFDQVQGVLDVESGYAGGHVANPSYEEVCDKTTGHAEVVKLQFDPEQISYAEILEIFFAVHDPTTLNRQGNDEGPQYRSAIFTLNDVQRTQAQKVIEQLQAEGVWGKKFVTEVTDYTNYYPAESYHQNYFEQHPGQGYCMFVVGPKVDKFRKKFAARLKAAYR